MDKLHSVESAAQFLGGISPWTIRAWLSQGRLSRIKIGSRTMVKEEELISLAKPETASQAAERNIAAVARHRKAKANPSRGSR